MKRQVSVIGIGAGNPEYVTMQAIKALNRVSVFFIPNKGDDKADLHHLRREICERYIEGDAYRLVDFDIPERSKAGAYKSDVAAWRAEVRRIYETLLTDELGADEVGGFLVWGDPSLYDGTMEILDTIRDEGRMDLDYEVIPGISSVSALAARHRIALNRIGEPLTITTARLVSQGLPETGGNVVVMLDSRSAYHQVDPDLDIHWGAYIGTDDEILVAGRLRDVREEIDRRRAAARDEKGWVMDTYMLSRGKG
ncbi:precorrin-6A synthase (deacetylating) [Pseudooceanicola sp. LIPI14-2-Ac024]|uniref:precorrin-6A synthase (deacetylating) n=1 Tax=Pseudooceanicola sp. LIPI14-2-Ac024 TaxID=3344875 RepID=UPI0035D04C38